MHVVVPLIFLLVANAAVASEPGGFACLGKNNAKVHAERVYLRIDDSQEIYFGARESKPPIVAKALSLNDDHQVKVYLDDQLVRSWSLSFAQLGSSGVLLWRSAGGWQMEPISEELCGVDKTGPPTPLPDCDPQRQVITRVVPRYPANSRLSAAREGFVRLSVDIDRSGAVLGAVVVESKPGTFFDRSAIEAVSQWTYESGAQACRQQATLEYLLDQ